MSIEDEIREREREIRKLRERQDSELKRAADEAEAAHRRFHEQNG